MSRFIAALRRALARRGLDVPFFELDASAALREQEAPWATDPRG